MKLTEVNAADAPVTLREVLDDTSLDAEENVPEDHVLKGELAHVRELSRSDSCSYPPASERVPAIRSATPSVANAMDDGELRRSTESAGLAGSTQTSTVSPRA
jgi:hypothetical protein